MIKIQNLTKTYGKQRVLDVKNLEINKKGIVGICGPSGCGKSTLLNSLAGLIDFEGEVVIKGTNINSLNERSKEDFRLKNIGFIFQDFKLFETMTVEDNVLYPLDVINNSRKSRKIERVKDLLEIVGLSSKRKEKVNNLSGGEKQRAAIARALVNEPSIILADEPTGCLDEENSQIIMKCLKHFSISSCVIVVSHDEELLKKYADEIIYFKDGLIRKKEELKQHKDFAKPLVIKNQKYRKKASISSSFLYRFTISKMKQKKYRVLLCNFVISLGLIGVGLSIGLKSIISKYIENMYASIVEESSIVIKKNDININKYNLNASDFNDILRVTKKDKTNILDIGCTYLNDYESMFKTTNDLYLITDSYVYEIPGFSARHINEYKWLDYETPIVYPYPNLSLNDDEFVLGLTYPQISELCFKLHIERSINSLSKYIIENPIKLYFSFQNIDWQFEDEQLFTLKGFTLEKESCIYHLNHQWNKFVFEDQMGLPTTNNISGTTSAPWVLKKIPFIHSDGNTDELLKRLRNDKYYDSYLLEIANKTYYPWFLRNTVVKDIPRILVFKNELGNIPYRYKNYFEELSPNISNLTFSTNGGYVFYPEALMSGFSTMTYFSYDQDLLDKCIDVNSTINLADNEQSLLPDGVVSGFYAQNSNNSVKFKHLSQNLIIGRKPNTLDEIVISSALANKLNGNLMIDGEKLCMGVTTSEKQISNDIVIREYITLQLNIVGIVESSKLQIFHDNDWTISFYQSRVGESIFNLSSYLVSLSVKNKAKIDDDIKIIERSFPEYEVSAPYSTIEESVDNICDFMSVLLLVLSIVSTVISIFLLSICNSLHTQENIHQIALSRCLGVSEKESRKFIYTHSLMMCSLSLLFSFIEYLFVSLLSSFSTSQSMGLNFVLSIDYLAIIAMFALCIGICFFSAYFSAKKTKKYKPIEALNL